MKALFLAVGLTLPVSPVLAEATSPSDGPIVEAASLTEDQLRQAIIGKTIYLNVSGFELPIRFQGQWADERQYGRSSRDLLTR